MRFTSPLNDRQHQVFLGEIGIVLSRGATETRHAGIEGSLKSSARILRDPVFGVSGH